MIYIGGGVALLYASKDLDKLPTANFDQKIGVQIIQNALKVCKILFFSLQLVHVFCMEKDRILMTGQFCRPQYTPLLQMRV